MGQHDYDGGDYPGALTNAETALLLQPNDAEAATLKVKAQDQIHQRESLQQQHDVALQAGQQDFAGGDYPGALTNAEAALSLQPNDVAAAALKKQAQDQINNREGLQQQHNVALQASRQHFAGGDYPGALTNAEVALSLQPNDAEAAALKRKAEGKIQQQQTLRQQHDVAFTSGQQDFAGGDYQGALTNAETALSLQPNDADALALKNQALEQIKHQQSLTLQHNIALQAGQQDFAGGDYQGALTNAETALSVQPNDAEALALKNQALDQIKHQQSLRQQHDVALQASQQDFTGGDYQGALTNAETALSLQPNDAVALALKNQAGGQIRHQQDLKQQHDLALQVGQQDFTGGDYQGALTNAEAALSLQPNDAAAAALKGKAQDQIKQQQQNYDLAVKKGQDDLANGDLQGAMTNAIQAEALGVSDKSKATDLQLAAQEKIDFQGATQSFKDGNYAGALSACDAHKGVQEFEQLRSGISQEKTAYDSAKDSFERGDYSFVDSLAKYQGKKYFEGLLAQARPQQAVFQNLETLTKNPANWGKVNSVLNNSSNADFIKKPGFEQFRSWLKQNDPAVTLGKQLALFEVWFGIKDNGDKTVLDPTTKQPADKLPPGIVMEPYSAYLGNLKTNYIDLGGDQSEHLKEIDKIQDKMNYWNQ